MSKSNNQSLFLQELKEKVINLYKADDLEQLVALAEPLIEQFPKELMLHAVIGAANMGLGNIKKSIASFEKSLQINPNHAEAHSNLGWAKHISGASEEAIENYDSALKINANFAEAYNNRGIAFRSTGNFFSLL